MSSAQFFSDMRELSADLFQQFGTPASIERITKAYDKRTDDVVETKDSVECLAILSTRKQMSENGVFIVERIATLNAKPNDGDELVMNNNKYKITDIETINPDGKAGISFKAVII